MCSECRAENTDCGRGMQQRKWGKTGSECGRTRHSNSDISRSKTGSGCGRLANPAKFDRFCLLCTIESGAELWWSTGKDAGLCRQSAKVCLSGSFSKIEIDRPSGLRLPVTCSQRNPRSTPPITAATSADAQALRLSACLNSTNEGVDHRLPECFGIRTQSIRSTALRNSRSPR